MTVFFEKWQAAGGAFSPTLTRHDPMAKISPDSPERREANEAIECINCGICFSACDTVRWSPEYLGPAALNRAWTLVNDVRDGANADRLKGCCCGTAVVTTVIRTSPCEQACPKALNPTASIAGLKRRTMHAYIRGDL